MLSCRRVSGRRRNRLLRVGGFALAVTLLLINHAPDLPGETPTATRLKALPAVHYGPPVAPGELASCFKYVETSRAGPRSPGSTYIKHDDSRNDAAVISLPDLAALAQTSATSVAQATADALYGFLEGGVGHVVLVPDSSANAWALEDVEAVRAAVAAAVDQHGVGLPTTFSALPPAASQCLGASGVSAGIAWATASGAPSILHVGFVSPLTRPSLRFGTARPRFLAQVAEDRGGLAQPLRKHFQACGGDAQQQCDPLPDAPLLCSRWLRPVVQYGLCHPAADHSYRRHSSVAANSPGDTALYSGHRLLEEVAPVTLPTGAAVYVAGLVTDSGFASGAGRALRYNRLADRSAGWVLVDIDAVGPGGQTAVELVLGLLQGNVTLLPPGRLCNTSLPPADAVVPTSTVEAAVAAARVALAEFVPQLQKGGAIPAALLVGAVKRAGEVMLAHGACTKDQLLTLARWMHVYVWALHAQEDRPRATAPPNATYGAPQPQLPPVVLEALAPAPRETLPHCYVDHHNVRDILLVVNFNDWNAGWAPSNVKNLLKMHGSAYPGIVVYSSKEHTPEITQGIPALNMFFCPGGGGNSLGLKAQMCTGLALTAFEGHLGYLIINDDAMISPWNMLAYRPDWEWHKPPVGYEWYYDCPGNQTEKERRAATGKYPFGGWCYNCWSWYDSYGPLSFKKIHDILPQWMLDNKLANYGRVDGVSCSMVDVFYVPGRLAAVFGSLCLLTAKTGTEVELAQATIWDMVALRSEREHLRNIFRGHRAEDAYDYRLHDWAHKFPFSKNTTLAVAWDAVNAAREHSLFYRPNITSLLARPLANDFY